ncbi:ABC-2 type transporter-domain-containing protein [Yarrowia lipolytica]|uniref:YALI0E14729p n=2 Tax=Yarrowia lipolytica TaxID=4952 RepID=Q6C5V9_YARLI|nr:YALI0E14729p [Yarrowia lipolytica CLIB122]QNQ00149.1 ZEB2-regulated ABC transporter 1 [Yarrowia lipolytica]RDW28715.1 ABC-2 type transporter-domain-containing protein [Yarrowia lipolytica]RDW35825.1 ABC-2 type transporter-domain-containing protein [Yarrowia lipolytica]RDW41659.1 ABC-2 type transporter-domain-containing protein [Yarrowia lipolytica]RDW47029.1 ABC-2 type transporter-domain-containing protein [Yarrowia lipolytica]|eukprot:XP_503953.2 YALI0E14729p [Yarrowia lipolytica CLIB122]
MAHYYPSGVSSVGNFDSLDVEIRSLAEGMVHKPHHRESRYIFDHTFDDEFREEHEDEYDYDMLRKTSFENPDVNPYVEASAEPELDPWSGEFNSRKWIKTVLGLKERFGNSKGITAGVSFKNLGAYGYGSRSDYQKTFLNVIVATGDLLRSAIGAKRTSKIQILRKCDGLVLPGETCVVLGRPGSGCTTFLKSIACETYGFHVEEETQWNYQGVPRDVMTKHCRGEIVYNAEHDIHFPHLTVGQTLMFAALARTPRNRVLGVTREQYARHTRDVTMATLGLSHTINTKVGSDLVRGVSGGERKRVSIAESVVCGAPLQCWDNSTRGLDAANATEFIRSLRLSAQMTGASMFVSLYQASQEAYDMFDKVCLLYEGRQIFFGKAGEATSYFEGLGFERAHRQTTGDFLTSLTNPVERRIKAGWEKLVPRTPEEFESRWRSSRTHALLVYNIDRFNTTHPLGGQGYVEFMKLRKESQARNTRLSSPYLLSWPMQVRLCLWRGFLLVRGDLSMTLMTIIGNFIMALILASMYYNLRESTDAFFSRSALLFLAMLLNAMASVLEIFVLYGQRPLIEKHKRYALYHPFAESIASMLVDLPTKLATLISVNLALYFMTNLRRTPGAFFIFLLFSFTCTMAMSMIFRFTASVTKTMEQALAPASVLVLALVIYTGFTLPVDYMHGWARWMNYLNPVAYAFEAVMVNEFRNRRFPCGLYVPSRSFYNSVPAESKSCVAIGAKLGQDYVDGSVFISTAYKYETGHLWRNLGILWAFAGFFCGVYLLAAEYVTMAQSKGEVLLFKRSQHRKNLKAKPDKRFQDVELGDNLGDHNLDQNLGDNHSTYSYQQPIQAQIPPSRYAQQAPMTPAPMMHVPMTPGGMLSPGQQMFSPGQQMMTPGPMSPAGMMTPGFTYVPPHGDTIHQPPTVGDDINYTTPAPQVNFTPATPAQYTTPATPAQYNTPGTPGITGGYEPPHGDTVHMPPTVGDDTNYIPTKVRTNLSLNSSKSNLQHSGVFQWTDVCYDIKVAGENKRLLDHIDGYVKPGTLTALMGASGAGKTTLLDVLADRKSTGIVHGDMLVNGQQRNASFQRKTGYVQQQDLHTATATVRESLEFSALLRQPSSVSRADKLAYVDEVISILEMDSYADAVVGVPGEGLNVEQRKRLTIGVELAAKPELLLFLDEPTSGLDSQTAWSIVSLLKKLAANGQAILCTIHQPSAILFQEFDRLLFLAAGGKTVYYGDLGDKASLLIEYFESNGADPCPDNGNPAEWMLEVIGAAPGSRAKKDWPSVWRYSQLRRQQREELDDMRLAFNADSQAALAVGGEDTDFAVSQWTQLYYVTKRLLQFHWRTPSYLWSKMTLCIGCALFIGFSFYKSARDIQGLQNQMFSIFLMFLIFTTVAEQIMPLFMIQRDLYEARERASKTYSWQVFLGGNMLAELPWQIIVAVVVFFCMYYPIGFYRIAAENHQTQERGALYFLFLLVFFIYDSTYAHMIGVMFNNHETAANFAYLLFSFCLMFCGVLATKESMPGFWIFMYRASPLTYFIGGFMATGLAGGKVTCSQHEILQFKPLKGNSCAQYMKPFLDNAGIFKGYLLNETATDMCHYCPIENADAYLDNASIFYGDRWRNFGIVFAYPIFNVCATFMLYYVLRVPGVRYKIASKVRWRRKKQ